MASIIKSAKGLVLASALGLVLGGVAVTAPAALYPGEDITMGEVKRFDQYLDRHPEVAEQLRKNPSLINNEDYKERHPELREWLKNHPEAREELKENPRAFMRRENRFDRHEARPSPVARVNKRH
jgi:hypothetical protein